MSFFTIKENSLEEFLKSIGSLVEEVVSIELDSNQTDIIVETKRAVEKHDFWPKLAFHCGANVYATQAKGKDLEKIVFDIRKDLSDFFPCRLEEIAGSTYIIFLTG